MTQVFVSMGFFPDDYFSGTVDYIARLQDADGAIPWFEGGPMDPWDHIESAMGLTIGGHFDQAKAAFYWLKNNQLPNGSWLAAYKDGKVEDGTRAESNFVAYIATGGWHYYLVTGDEEFLSDHEREKRFNFFFIIIESIKFLSLSTRRGLSKKISTLL